MGETSHTKQLIKQVLINLCEQHSFRKISVQQIAQEAGINRQTFYYHFTDKVDLLHWVYYDDSLHFLESEALSLDNWEEQALKMLKAIAENKEFYASTVSSEQEILQKQFTALIQPSFIKIFEQMDEEKQLTASDKLFYARFFSYGCSGVLVNWIIQGYTETPLEIAMQLFRLAKDTELYSYRLYAMEEEQENQ
ncbi:TetR family dihydroxyacetone kinase regulator [Enterococcus sp. 10A9_DIV0425]|uniref:TetR family dihydroxyacetone kinase regulator n=1 Tax=Candidatus Enterococcus wittei TaxID=1987383 RepID=A0A242JZW1_9ENTE|nr:TetR/AcrR family transcriptional regulator [Enterococcus sp. 10A9_DIV0425]OTP10940.1 TetR family dihydroxyacetone kinase regulator [Enterococcus sp. 10A9_DIV0425]THE16291.1 TetR family transcriptional regulator [Enterococcus hirae]